MTINGTQLDFDITSPSDVLRYKEAGERMETRGKETSWPLELDPSSPTYLDHYVEMLNIELQLYGDFIDDVFGDGVANELLGDNPSLTKVTEVIDAMTEAFSAQGRDFGVKLKKYTPNRATRRGKK